MDCQINNNCKSDGKLYTYFENGKVKVYRHSEFLNSFECTKTQKTALAASVVVGASSGSFAGFFIGKQIESYLISVIPKVDEKTENVNTMNTIANDYFSFSIGGTIGGLLGGIGGIIGGISGYMYFIERSSSYISWVQEKFRKIIPEIADDEILSIFAGLDYEIIKHPVRCPSGNLHDLYSLLKISGKDEQGNIRCPNRNGSFPKEALQKDEEANLVILKRYYYLLREVVEKGSESPEKLKEIQSCLPILEKLIDEVYKECKVKIYNLLINDRISDEQHSEEVVLFKKLFGTKPLDELNWDLDWKDILRQRWLNFHRR